MFHFVYCLSPNLVQDSYKLSSNQLHHKNDNFAHDTTKDRFHGHEEDNITFISKFGPSVMKVKGTWKPSCMIQHYQLLKVILYKFLVVDSDGWWCGFLDLLCVYVVGCFASYVWWFDLLLQ